jgi:hypothetical protein
LKPNVLVSAPIADGPPSRLLEEAIDGRIELVRGPSSSSTS